CAPHRASAGTSSSPMLSCSVRNLLMLTPELKNQTGIIALCPDSLVSRMLHVGWTLARPADQSGPYGSVGIAAPLQYPAAHPRNSTMQLDTLTALSPLDGRYAGKTEALRPIFSEFGLMHRRVHVEISWLLALGAEPSIHELPAFSDDMAARLRAVD